MKVIVITLNIVKITILMTYLWFQQFAEVSWNFQLLLLPVPFVLLCQGTKILVAALTPQRIRLAGSGTSKTNRKARPLPTIATITDTAVASGVEKGLHDRHYSCRLPATR